MGKRLLSLMKQERQLGLADKKDIQKQRELKSTKEERLAEKGRILWFWMKEREQACCRLWDDILKVNKLNIVKEWERERERAVNSEMMF